MNLEGFRKILATFIPMGVGVANAAVVSLNLPLPKDYTWGAIILWAVEVIVLMSPTWIAAIMGTSYNKANVAQKESYNNVTIAKIEAGIPIDVSPTPASVPTVINTPIANLPEEVRFPSDLDAFKSVINKEIDKANATGNVIYSSANPTMVWSRSQSRAMAIEIEDAPQAIAYYDQILFPAAQAAYIDQMAQLSGQKCAWPIAAEAAKWMMWCKDNSANLKLLSEKKVFNFKGYDVWRAGEIATGIVEKRIAIDMKRGSGGLPEPVYYS